MYSPATHCGTRLTASSFTPGEDLLLCPCCASSRVRAAALFCDECGAVTVLPQDEWLGPPVLRLKPDRRRQPRG